MFTGSLIPLLSAVSKIFCKILTPVYYCSETVSLLKQIPVKYIRKTKFLSGTQSASTFRRYTDKLSDEITFLCQNGHPSCVKLGHYITCLKDYGMKLPEKSIKNFDVLSEDSHHSFA
jgi:hypothetical protein